MRQSKLILLISCVLPVICLGQDSPNATEIALWKTRAEAISSQLLQGSFKLQPTDKAELYAELANRWHTVDTVRSATYGEEAVDTLFFMSSEEVGADIPRYLRTIRNVLLALGDREPEETKRLLSILSDADKIPKKNAGISADLLIEFALSVVADNPRMASDLGHAAFELGQPSEFYRLYWELRKADNQLSNRFLDTAIRSANSQPTIQIGLGLKNAVFPEMIFPDISDILRSSSTQKTAVLDFLAGLIVNASSRLARGEISSCSNEAMLIVPLRSHFALLLREKVVFIEQAVARCLAASTQPRESGSKGSERNATTVQDFLDLAESSDSSQQRSYYLFRAASLANDLEQFEIATDVLVKMTEDERNTDIGYWESLRYTVAAGAAFAKLIENSPAQAIDELAAVPSDIRAFAKVGFVMKCPSENMEIRDFCLALLNGANADFSRSKKPLSEKFNTWLQIVGIYARVRNYSEAAKTFDLVVTDLNAQDKNRDFHFAVDQLTPVFSVDLLNADEHRLTASMNRISDPTSRINTGLAFLTIALRHLEEISIRPRPNRE